MTDNIFETKFWNRTRKPYAIYENGSVFTVLASDEIYTMVSENPLTSYARWCEVVILPSEVKLTPRPGWVEPTRLGYVTEFLNSDGEIIEVRMINGSPLTLPRQIPILVSVSLSDPYIWYERVEILKRVKRVRSVDHEGYYYHIPVLQNIKVQRDKKAQQKILEEMKSIPDFVIPELEIISEEQKEPVYVCTFENQKKEITDSTTVMGQRGYGLTVSDDSGRPFFTLLPGQKIDIEAWDPKVWYARFSKIVFAADGKTKLEENPQWRNPYEGWTIELFNQDSPAMQGLTIFDGRASETRKAPHSIPTIHLIGVADANCVYRKISWVRKKTRRPLPGFPGYFEDVVEVCEEKELRGKSEVEQILKEREQWLAERNRQKDATFLKRAQAEQKKFQEMLFGKK